MSNRRMHCSYGQALGLVTGVVAGTFALGSGPALAQAPAAAAPASKGWESTASAGLTLTRGNTRSFMVALGINTIKKWQANELLPGGGDEALLGANYGYGNNTIPTPQGPVDSKLVDYYSFYGQFNHLFTERFYGGLRMDYLHDQIADIGYRFTVSPLAGYYLVKNATTRLSVEAGPTLVEEKKGGSSRGYWAIRAADRFEHKFSERAKIWQTAEYVAQPDHFSNYYVNAEVGVESAITKALSLRLLLQDQFINQPALGRQRNDLKFLAGMGYTF